MGAILQSFDPIALGSGLAGLLLFGLMYFFMQGHDENRARSEVRKRLDFNHVTEGARGGCRNAGRAQIHGAQDRPAHQ